MKGDPFVAVANNTKMEAHGYVAFTDHHFLMEPIWIPIPQTLFANYTDYNGTSRFHQEEKAELLHKEPQLPKPQQRSYVLRGLAASLLLLVLFHTLPSFVGTIPSQAPPERKLYDFENVTPTLNEPFRS